MHKRSQKQPIACDMDALPNPDHHRAITEVLFSQACSVVELDDGYTVVFPVAAFHLITVFVDGERRCCPFLRFIIDIAPDRRTVHLTLSGHHDEVKAFLRAALLPSLPVMADLTEQA